MQFETPLLTGRFVRRYKRFFADIELEDGEIVVSHCANPGSMKTCAPDGARVWVARSDNPRRKLEYTWELVESSGATVCVNTGRANKVVEEALRAGRIPELGDYPVIRREVRYGERSRVDFLLSRGEEHCYLEVKSVTMDGGDGLSVFPDSVTERGSRHLEELMRIVDQGHRAVLLFCCARSDVRRVRPADEIDPAYGKTLRRARAAGVEILAYRCEVSPAGVWLQAPVPVELPRLC